MSGGIGMKRKGQGYSPVTLDLVTAWFFGLALVTIGAVIAIGLAFGR